MTDQADRERESRETDDSGFERRLQSEEAERASAADRASAPPPPDSDDDND